MEEEGVCELDGWGSILRFFSILLRGRERRGEAVQNSFVRAGHDLDGDGGGVVVPCGGGFFGGCGGLDGLAGLLGRIAIFGSIVSLALGHCCEF